MLDEDDKIAINKAMDMKRSKVVVKEEKTKEPTVIQTTPNGDIKIKTEIVNDEICGNIDAIESEKSEETVGNDTIVVDGNVVMEPLGNSTESEGQESYSAGAAEFLLSSDLEPSVEMEVEESLSEEYTPNVVEVDVTSSSDLSCPICDMTFTLKKSVRRHVKNIHKIYKDVNETSATAASENITHETVDQDVQAGKSHSSEVSKEVDVPKEVETRKEMTDTTSETIYKCEECGEEQSWKDHYKHVRTVHGYSAKAAIKSVARTKKRIAEEKDESTAKRKKTCWVRLVKFDSIPHDELPGIVSDLPVTTEMDESISGVEVKVVEKIIDEAAPVMVKRKSKSCEVCHIDVSHNNFNRHMAAKHGESTKNSSEPSTKDEVLGEVMNGTVDETLQDLEQVKQPALRLKDMKLEDKIVTVEENVEKNTNDENGDAKVSEEDSSGRTVCKICSIEVSASYLRRHMRRVHKTKLKDLDDSKLEDVSEKHADFESENDLSSIEVKVLNNDNEENKNPSEPSKHDDVLEAPSVTVSDPNEKDPNLAVRDSSVPSNPPQDSGVFLEKLKLKLLLDSDDEDDEASEPKSVEIKTEKAVMIKEATEDRKTIIENLKPNCNESKIGHFSRTISSSRAEFEIVKDPNLPPNWLVRYTSRPDLNRTDREFITPENKRIRSIVKMLDYMSESKQYKPEEIERVKEYFKKPRVSLEHLKSLPINNS